jgi:hypothetical protein
VQRSAGRRTGAAFTALPETRPKQERIDDAENSNRNGCIVGKAPIGKYPVGKYPIGKYPQPVVTKG